MIKLLIYIFRICLLTSVIATCASCEPNNIENEKAENKSVILRLVVETDEQINVATRTVSETGIHDLHVLVYDSDENLIGQKYWIGNGSVDVMIRNIDSSTKKCMVYVIANSNKADLFKGYDIQKASCLRNMTYNISTWDELTNGNYLVMTGYKEDVDVTTGSQTLSMKVKRIAAKITLNIGIKTGSGITIKDYTVYNLPLSSYYTPRPLATESNKDDNAAGEDAPTQASDWGNSTVFSLTAGTTSTSKIFYMFENRRGVNNAISQQSDKTSVNVPAVHATYVGINGTVNGLNVNWKVYLGANNTTNFNIKRNCQYTYNITLNDHYSDTRVTIDNSDVINLSETGTANCYLVSKKNTWYKFKATVRGNGTKTIKDISPIAYASSDLPAGETMNPTGVELVWETHGHKQIIDSYMLYNGYVYFKTGANVTEGNAVIAVNDDSGILWSWHIWRTSFDLAGLNNSHTQRYKTSPKYLTGYNVIRTRYMNMMDRDLGASSNTPSQTDDVIKTFGLLYQWGRKDPFPPGKARISIDDSGTTEMVNIYDASGNLIDPRDATHQVPSLTAGNAGEDITPNIEYGIKHPITFCTRMANDYLGNYSSQSWIYGCYNDGSITSNRWKKSILLWGGGMKDAVSPNYYNSFDTKKSIYDPCPEGWCLPTQEVWSNFTITECITSDPSLYNCTEKQNYPLPDAFLKAKVFGRQFYINADNNETAFYPAAGFRRGDYGKIVVIGQFACAWSSSIFHNSSPNGYSCGILGASNALTHSLRFGHQSDTFPVRCVKESDMDQR